MESMIKTKKKLFFLIGVPVSGFILFCIFMQYFSSILLDGFATFLNDKINNFSQTPNSSGILNFGSWVFKLIMLPWLSSVLYVMISFCLNKWITNSRFISGLRVNLIISIIVLTYYSFELIRYYMS